MKCAFYEKEITPPIGDDIPGYYAHRYTVNVEDKLYAKAVVFEDGGNYCALLTIDCVCVHESLCEKIRDRVCQFTDIPRNSIAVISNHSHYGIPIGDSVSDRDEEYMAIFDKLAADTIILAYKRLEPCTLEYAIGQKGNVAFVRDCVMEDGRVLTNPSSKLGVKVVKTYKKSDDDLPVLVAKNSDGKMLGIVFTFALHQDTTGSTLMGNHAFSGDYSSEISHRLKANYGYDFVSVYLPGFCGDINHHDFVGGKKQNHRTIGKELAEALFEIIPTAKQIEKSGVDAKFTKVTLARRRATPEQIERAKYVSADRENRRTPADPCGGRLYEEMLKYEEAVANLPLTVDIPLQLFTVGDVNMYISPFEVYSAYAEPLKKMTASGKWLMSELANYESSYIPTPELMGSEVYPAQLCYGSWLETEAGNKIVDTFSKMIK